MYDLVAVVIHCGSGPNRGHYISIVKSHGLWLLFDDDIVDVSPKIDFVGGIFFLTAWRSGLTSKSRIFGSM